MNKLQFVLALLIASASAMASPQSTPVIHCDPAQPAVINGSLSMGCFRLSDHRFCQARLDFFVAVLPRIWVATANPVASIVVHFEQVL
ncbi:hypothetical protein BD779DRAFT_1678061 [Infundibulicybe gibba]|nr:hypothetical protein BD779DRAFT_1678061 [Infundibulicybe gibba]